jgi:hypothetical protein
VTAKQKAKTLPQPKQYRFATYTDPNTGQTATALSDAQRKQLAEAKSLCKSLLSVEERQEARRLYTAVADAIANVLAWCRPITPPKPEAPADAEAAD